MQYFFVFILFKLGKFCVDVSNVIAIFFCVHFFFFKVVIVSSLWGWRDERRSSKCYIDELDQVNFIATGEKTSKFIMIWNSVTYRAMLLERDLPKLSISSFPVYSSSQPTLNCSQYKNDNKTYIYLANFENTKTRSSEYSF